MNTFRPTKQEMKLKPADKKRQELIQQLEPRRLLSMTSAPEFIPDVNTAAGSGFSPSQITTAYGVSGLTISNGKAADDGAGQTVSVINAYNAPTIAGDLRAFDSPFALPSESLKVGNPIDGGSLTPGGSWNWMHAIAPGPNGMPAQTNSFDTPVPIDRVNQAPGVSGVPVVSAAPGTSTPALAVAVQVPSNPPTSIAGTVSNVSRLQITQALYASSLTQASAATPGALPSSVNGQTFAPASSATGSTSTFKGFAPVVQQLPPAIDQEGAGTAPAAGATVEQAFSSVKVFAQETISQLGRDLAVDLAHEEITTVDSMLATFTPERRTTAAAIAATVVAIACLESEAGRNKKKLSSTFSGRMIAQIPER